jgi:hypothetical protein
MSRRDIKQKGNDYYNQGNEKMYNAYDELANQNYGLNRAFQLGQKARKNHKYNTIGGTYTNGTGTSSEAFKRLK